MSKYSKKTMCYSFMNFSIYEIILKELESGNPDWEKIKNTISGDEPTNEDIEEINYLKNLYEQKPDIAIEMYEDMLYEDINEQANDFASEKTASIKTEINVTNDMYSEIQEYFGDGIIKKTKELIEQINPESVDGIVHIGILENSDKLGLFCPEYDKRVKNIYMSSFDNINENDIVNEQKKREGISFLINPKKIQEEAMDLLPKQTSSEEIQELISIILAEIIVHESSHTKGEGYTNENSEDIPVLKERKFLQEAVDIVNQERTENGKNILNVDLK